MEEQKAKSIKRRRAGRKAYKTRIDREQKTHESIAVYNALKDKTVEVVDRSVLRVAKESFIKFKKKWHDRDIKAQEVVDFTQACAEVARLCSVARFAERLDAGETVETSEAFYSLHASQAREVTVAQAVDESTKRLESLINLQRGIKNELKGR